MNLLAAKPRRTFSLLIGIALLGAALWAVIGNHTSAAAAWHALRDPQPLWIVVLPITVVATALGTAASLMVLTNRVATETHVRLSEMLALTWVSTLGNYLPMQPGLVGRVAYQHQILQIPVAVSVLLAVQSTLLTVAAVCWLGLALLLVHAGQLSWIAAPLSVFILAATAFDARWHLKPIHAAFVIRFAEILVSGLCTYAAFALIGKPIDPLAALVFACASNASHCIPFIGNGMGIREWSIGLLAPVVAGISTPDALAAELIHRAVEFLVVVPAGLTSMVPLMRRIRNSVETVRVQRAPPSEFTMSVQLGSTGTQRLASGTSNDDLLPPNTPASSSP